ncbi:hypothetical protein SOVF_189820 isoform B [Spinacia oleracea]|nr:hypothetical protein SOVF_189820 isoform B [Spinacia oleracea]
MAYLPYMMAIELSDLASQQQRISKVSKMERNYMQIFSPNPYTQEEIDDDREKRSRYFISSCL